MNANNIIIEAKKCSKMKYWYGGKGQIASIKLANQLMKQNPSTWTQSYYNKAIRDIDGTTKVGDCSYLVCRAYGISQIGSYQIRDKYSIWYGNPKNGMILWRPGHVAIYNESKAIQLKGIDYDYKELSISQDIYVYVLYDKSINYDGPVNDMSKGWHKDSIGWYYRHIYGTGKNTYFSSGIYPCETSKGIMYFGFDDKGYMITDINKISITEFGNLEVKLW